MAEFAMAYTDQTERERRALVDAIKGRSDQRVDAGALPRKRDRSIWSRRACVRSAAANDRAFGSEADGALPGRPDGDAVDLDGTLTPAPDAMADEFRRAGLTGNIRPQRRRAFVSAQGGQKPLYVIPLGRALLAHAIAEAPPVRRQATDDPRQSEGSGFYERNSPVRIGGAPSDAAPRRPATAPRIQARSHDITVTSGLTGRRIPGSSGSRSRFGRQSPRFSALGLRDAMGRAARRWHHRRCS
jgi:hypothetical protein